MVVDQLHELPDWKTLTDEERFELEAESHVHEADDDLKRLAERQDGCLEQVSKAKGEGVLVVAANLLLVQRLLTGGEHPAIAGLIQRSTRLAAMIRMESEIAVGMTDLADLALKRGQSWPLSK